jgi:hypothetical protein
VDGSGTGTFTSSITGLSPGILYYVRAYATNSNGTDYGAQVSFTSAKAPTVAATSAATSITYYTAVMSGNISSDNGVAITARGFVYATAATTTSPTTANTVVTISGTATGTYTGTITGLVPSTTYYVSSYATNSQGTTYGTPISFTTPVPTTGSGLTQATAAASGYELAQNYPSSPSGWYWIKPTGQANAIQMYVDMVQDGGGYDFYFITAGTSVSTVSATNSGAALGLDLVMPRSSAHWVAMSNAVNAAITSSPSTYGTYAQYFQTAYAVYNTTAASYTAYIMRDARAYGTGVPANTYGVKDGGKWWLRDATFSEPNGDYTPYGLLGINSAGYSFPNPYTLGTNLGFNDGGAYSTGDHYLVSTNKKP